MNAHDSALDHRWRNIMRSKRFLSLAVTSAFAGCVSVSDAPHPVAPKPDVEHLVATYGSNCRGVGAATLPAPIYPKSAHIRGQTGWVLLKFDISSGGKPENVQVVNASPKGHFEAAAKRVVERGTFTTPEGRTYRDCLQFIDFNLE
jgi:TonB family protein